MYNPGLQVGRATECRFLFFKKASYPFAIKLSGIKKKKEKQKIIWPPKEAKHIKIKELANKKFLQIYSDFRKIYYMGLNIDRDLHFHMNPVKDHNKIVYKGNASYIQKAVLLCKFHDKSSLSSLQELSRATTII